MKAQFVPKPGRKVTIEHLKAVGAAGETCHLYCRKCGGRYSANFSDYFWAPAGHTFKCCKVNNILIVGRSS